LFSHKEDGEALLITRTFRPVGSPESKDAVVELPSSG
jgi:hypothetical protein